LANFIKILFEERRASNTAESVQSSWNLGEASCVAFLFTGYGQIVFILASSLLCN